VQLERSLPRATARHLRCSSRRCPRMTGALHRVYMFEPFHPYNSQSLFWPTDTALVRSHALFPGFSWMTLHEVVGFHHPTGAQHQLQSVRHATSHASSPNRIVWPTLAKRAPCTQLIPPQTPQPAQARQLEADCDLCYLGTHNTTANLLAK
jgi:hypothetical protein